MNDLFVLLFSGTSALALFAMLGMAWFAYQDWRKKRNKRT